MHHLRYVKDAGLNSETLWQLFIKNHNSLDIPELVIRTGCLPVTSLECPFDLELGSMTVHREG